MQIHRPEMHAMGFRVLFDHGRTVLGDVRFKAILADLGADEGLMADSTAWFSLEFAEALVERLVKEAGSIEFLVDAAQQMLTRKYLGPLYPLYRAFGSPTFTYLRVLPLVRRMNKVGEFRVIEGRRGHALLEYRSYPDAPRERTNLMCTIRTAQLQCGTALFDLPPARVEHGQCMSRGDASCVYDVTWSERPRRSVSWVGFMVGAVAGGASTIVASDTVAPWLFVTVSSLAGWSLGRNAELRAELTERAREVEDHRESLTYSAQVNEQRYVELLEAKAEVERKVEQRTAELQQTTQQLSVTLAELQALDRSKTDFFNNVSHELRSPLTLILGPLEDLVAGREPAGGSEEALKTMQRNASRLLHLINQLLDLAKIDAGKMAITRTQTDMAALARAILNNFESAASKRKVTLVCDAPDLMPAIAVDSSWIESALTNLLANAMRFVGDGGHVTVRVTDRGEALDLQVIDDGAGIPEADLERIFQRFAQADVATLGSGGTGIGLALVREAARMHGGDVRVESSVGKGAVFTLSLPRTFEPSVPIEGARNTLAPRRREGDVVVAQLDDELIQDRRSSHPPSHYGPLAIVAEDNRDLRNYMADVLSATYRVQTASDGVEALELARKLHPDVVVSDVGMPRLDGFGLCRALRADPETRSVAVVLVTARDDLGSALEGFDAGANDYLPKPFHGRELLARVGVHVRMRHMIREMAARERLSTLGVLAASVAHQVRNPLTTLVGGLPAMRKKLGSVDPRSEEMFNVMIDCAHRIERLTTDLLDVSRIDREEQGELSPAQGLRSAIRLVTARLPDSVTLETDIDDKVRIYGRAGDLNHVFLNLIDNAVHAAGDQGTIRVTARVHEATFVVSVEDSGVGIDPADVDQIFDPFFTTRKAGEGTGLGLSIARQVVDQHGGTLRVHRSNLGGASFVVRLPVTRAATNAVA